MVELFLNSLVLFFVVIDPIGTIAIFLSILPNIKGNKRNIALESVLYAFLILVFFMLLGRIILNHLNISLYAFKIAGGIILLLIAIEMLLNKRVKRRAQVMKDEKPAVTAIFPLAVPLLAGPAAITSVIVSSSNIKSNLNMYIINIFALFLVLLITLATFLLAIKYEKYINTKFLEVLSRIISILLCALSIQFILDGLSEFYLDVKK